MNYIKNWLIRHNFRKPDTSRKVEQKEPTLRDIMGIYNFHHNHSTNALNLIMSTKFGNEYQFSFMSVQDQIINMRNNLYHRQSQFLEKEDYKQAAKFRDDIVRMDQLIENLYK